MRLELRLLHATLFALQLCRDLYFTAFTILLTVFINRGNRRADYGVAIVRVEENCEMWALPKERD